MIRGLIDEPLREELNFVERWRGPDRGIIFCWESGRRLRLEKPEIAAQAVEGELVPLWWEGGVRQKLKSNAMKFGSQFYLATWQGLRGDNLDIDMEAEFELICARTGQAVTYR